MPLLDLALFQLLLSPTHCQALTGAGSCRGTLQAALHSSRRDSAGPGLKDEVRTTHLQACCCCLSGPSPLLHPQSSPALPVLLPGAGWWELWPQQGTGSRESWGNALGMVPVTLKRHKRFEGKQFTRGTETEAGGTGCEHPVLGTSYLKLQIPLRCSWVKRRGTTAACTTHPGFGALLVQLQQLRGQQGLGTSPETKES